MNSFCFVLPSALVPKPQKKSKNLGGKNCHLKTVLTLVTPNAAVQQETLSTYLSLVFTEAANLSFLEKDSHWRNLFLQFAWNREIHAFSLEINAVLVWLCSSYWRTKNFRNFFDSKKTSELTEISLEYSEKAKMAIRGALAHKNTPSDV